MNYCNDCYRFKRTDLNKGECRDPSKVIYDGMGRNITGQIIVGSSNHCSNWVSRKDVEEGPVMA